MTPPEWTGRLSTETLGLLGHHLRHRHRGAGKKRNRAHTDGCSNDSAAEAGDNSEYFHNLDSCSADPRIEAA